VEEHRVFTTHQLAEVFFDSLDRAEDRLEQLTDQGVLARFRPHRRHGEGSAPYHYVLGPAGAAVLAAEQDIGPRTIVPGGQGPRDCRQPHLGHLVGVNGCFASLAAHATQRSG